MTTERKTCFISDLHLQESQPDITRQFLDFLTTCTANANALYILGDLFEVWIGDDENTPFQRSIIQALHSATQHGLPIYFLHGNRDFLIGKTFLRATGCQLLNDEEKINLYGTPVLLMHGDTLCTRDRVYLKARKKSRSRILQTVFLLLPLKTRKKLAANMRAKSALHTQSTPMEIMDVTQEEVLLVMQKYAVQFLIHGHTHRPATHEFTINHMQAQRIVLGAWHEGGNALMWYPSGKKEWVKF